MVDQFNPRELLKLANTIQEDADRVGLGIDRDSSHSSDVQDRSLILQFDSMITSRDLSDASRDLLADGYYSSAVENAFKCLNNAVKEKSGLMRLDGDSLMRQAFSANSPTLKLNSFQSPSEHNEQRGYMDIFAGVMSGIRNPRAHEHEIMDDPDVALEMIIIANHLMRKLDSSTLSTSDCEI